MAGSIEFLIGDHPVYCSSKAVFSIISKKNSLSLESGPKPRHSHSLQVTPTTHLKYSKLEFSPKRLYVSISPLLALESMEILLNNNPAVFVEEYFPRSGVKDKAVSLVLKRYKKYPFIALTRRTFTFLKSLGLEAFLVHPGIAKQTGSKPRGHILFASRFYPNKNPEMAIALARTFPNEKFVLLANDTSQKRVDEIRGLGKDLDNLEVVGIIKNPGDLQDYFKKSKLLIHPAHQDPVGNVIIEALSTQTPVLASSGAGASDFLPKEWVCSPKDEKEWIEKTKYILEHQEESIKNAEETFEKEHLDIDDPYFEKVAEELAETLKKKWPKLFAKD